VKLLKVLTKPVKVPKAKRRHRFTWYQLSGAPFLILSDADRDLLLRDFASLLATVKHGVLLVKRRLDKFVYRDYAFDVTHYDFYLGAKGSREVFFFNAKRVDNIDRPRVKGSAGVKTLVLEDGFMWLLASQLLSTWVTVHRMAQLHRFLTRYAICVDPRLRGSGYCIT
jgi:hypothetical protein